MNRHGKPSLASNVGEQFRPAIADSAMIAISNNDGLSPADFHTWRDARMLAETGRKAIFQAYEQRKATAVTHPVYGYKMSAARMLAGYVRGAGPDYAGFTVRRSAKAIKAIKAIAFFPSP